MENNALYWFMFGFIGDEIVRYLMKLWDNRGGKVG